MWLGKWCKSVINWSIGIMGLFIGYVIICFDSIICRLDLRICFDGGSIIYFI